MAAQRNVDIVLKDQSTGINYNITLSHEDYSRVLSDVTFQQKLLEKLIQESRQENIKVVENKALNSEEITKESDSNWMHKSILLLLDTYKKVTLLFFFVNQREYIEKTSVGEYC